jgi:hypothetical protein
MECREFRPTQEIEWKGSSISSPGKESAVSSHLFNFGSERCCLSRVLYTANWEDKQIKFIRILICDEKIPKIPSFTPISSGKLPNRPPFALSASGQFGSVLCLTRIPPRN